MNGAIDLLLRSLPIIIGGGIVQLVVVLIKRRAENRALNAGALRNEAESGQFVVQSAEKSVELSDRIRDRAVEYAEAKEAEAVALREEVRALRVDARALMERVHTLESTLAGVEALRAEVASLRAENVELRAQAEICRRTHLETP